MCKRIIRKVSFNVILIVCFIISYKTMSEVEASSYSFSYWYSDEDTGGYWSSAPNTFYVELDGTVNVMPSLNTARVLWNNAGISSNITTSQTFADITFYGGRRAQLNAIGFFYTSTTYGQTYWDSSTTVSETGSSYKIKRLNAVSASLCSETNTNYYDKVVLHEYGHSLGWYGHSAYQSDVMYSNTNYSGESLTSRDKNHLLQIYNEMN